MAVLGTVIGSSVVIVVKKMEVRFIIVYIMQLVLYNITRVVRKG